MGDKGAVQIIQKLVLTRHLEEVQFNDVGLTDIAIEMIIYTLQKH